MDEKHADSADCAQGFHHTLLPLRGCGEYMCGALPPTLAGFGVLGFSLSTSFRYTLKHSLKTLQKQLNIVVQSVKMIKAEIKLNNEICFQPRSVVDQNTFQNPSQNQSELDAKSMKIGS